MSQADAEQGAVLLKNDGDLLPLGPGVRSIVVIGGHADEGVLAGGGSSLVYPRGGNAAPGIAPTAWPGPVMYYPSSPFDELRRLLPQAKITFVDGTDRAAAAAAARAADVAIVFGTQWSGEGFDVAMALDRQSERADRRGCAGEPADRRRARNRRRRGHALGCARAGDP